MRKITTRILQLDKVVSCIL